MSVEPRLFLVKMFSCFFRAFKQRVSQYHLTAMPNSSERLEVCLFSLFI